MIKRVLTYTIPADQGGRTVEEYLRGLGYSHRLVVHLKQTPGGILAGGESVFSTYRLHPGQVLTVTLTEEEPSRNIPPAELPLTIVYEDADILVVNKEAGIPVHPSQGHHGNTLANAVAHYYALRGEPFVYRAVSRLDRDTSGLLVLAKHMLSACSLAGQMEDRRIRRRYLAFVRGLMPDSGSVTAPIGRAPGSVIQRCVDLEQGEPACTHYSRLLYNQKMDLSLISLSLENPSDPGPHGLRRPPAAGRFPLLPGLPLNQPPAPALLASGVLPPRNRKAHGVHRSPAPGYGGAAAGRG